MSFDLTSIIIDESVSKQGVWVDFLGGSRLKIASSNSQAYKSAVARLYKQNRLKLDDSNPDNIRLIQEITARAMSETLLLDWEGIDFFDKAGNPVKNIPYSPERGFQALILADQLRDFVSETASKPSLFQAEIVEEALGN